MWKNKLLKTVSIKIHTQPVWKSFGFPQIGCGEKNAAALREIALFHISSYYYYHYYL
jgi:hypothetical protein